MRKTLVAVSLATAALAVPSLAAAQAAAPAADKPASPHTFTGNVGLFSQYIFRGLTQTNGKPALQGGVDYGHSSGFYVGTWGSNVSWFEETNVGTPAAPISLASPGAAGAPFTANRFNNNNLEIDIYGGWKNTWGDWGLDVGLLQYWYPGTYDNLGGLFAKPNTLEAYIGGSWKWISLKYSHALSNAFGVRDSRGSSYIDLSANVPIADSGFTLNLHIGHQRFSGNSPVWAFSFPGGGAPNNSVLNYTDYKIGVTKEWVGLNWLAYYTSTNTKGQITAGTPPVAGAIWNNVYGKDIGKGTFTIAVQKTF